MKALLDKVMGRFASKELESKDLL